MVDILVKQGLGLSPRLGSKLSPGSYVRVKIKGDRS